MHLEIPQVFVGLLADHPHLVRAVAEMRWREWGEPSQVGLSGLDGFVEITMREAGREQLPITWVAVEPAGQAVGAAALVPISEIEEKPEYAPTLGGVIVDPAWRGLGAGRRLLETIEQWAVEQGIRRMWVVAGGEAVRFYKACGWVVVEERTVTWPNVDVEEKVCILSRTI